MMFNGDFLVGKNLRPYRLLRSAVADSLVIWGFITAPKRSFLFFCSWTMTSTIFRNIMFWYFLLANGKKDNTGNWKPTVVIFARKSKFLPHLAQGHRPFRPCSPGTIGNLLQMWFKAHFHRDLSCSQCQYVCLVSRVDKIFAEAKATFKNVLRCENWKVEADYANKEYKGK